TKPSHRSKAKQSVREQVTPADLREESWVPLRPADVTTQPTDQAVTTVVEVERDDKTQEGGQADASDVFAETNAATAHAQEVKDMLQSQTAVMTEELSAEENGDSEQEEEIPGQTPDNQAASVKEITPDATRPNDTRQGVTFRVRNIAVQLYNKMPGAHNPYLKRSLAGLVVVAVLSGIMTIGMLVNYAHRAVELQLPKTQAYDSPISVRFSRPVQKNLEYTWSNKIEGTWEVTKNFGGVSRVTFTPKKHFVPGSRLKLRISSIAPSLDVLSATKQTQSVTIQIESAANVSKLTPTPEAKNVGIHSEVTVTLTSRNRNLRKLCLEGDVPIKKPCVPESADDKTFRWALERSLDQTRTYTVSVVDQNQPVASRVLKTFTFETVHEPQVSTSFSGALHPGDTLDLSFDQDMQTDAAINFAMPGNGSWENPKHYTFKVGAVTPGQTYEYKVLAGAKATSGGFVATDRVFTAATPGAVRVVSATPTGAKVPLDATISFTFDQPVDHTSAQAAFSMSPQVAGSFSWTGNTMNFKPNGMPHQTGYTATIAPGIKPVFGLPGVGYTLQFVTIYETKKLAVPYYRQAHSLSCEAASLRMALGYYGVNTSDDEILGRIGYAPQPRDTATNTWQDPYQMFVGSVDGRIGVDGWGVYAGPVARAAQSFGRSAQPISGVSAEKVAAEIYAGHPIVLWGISGSRPIMDSWNTTTSGVVSVPRNAHVRTVYGVDGTADNPVGFYLHDPISGGMYMTAGQLRANSAGNGGNAVVVY
ncbi:MAG: C39 family peptidase, partial [Candidatus Saccharimonadales bacterium]